MATARKTAAKAAPETAGAVASEGGAKAKGAGKKVRPAMEGEPTLAHVLDRLAVVEKKLDKVLRLVKPEK